jgi:hypothetical protein
VSVDLAALVGEVRTFAEDALGDDADKLKEAVAKGLEGIKKAQDLLEKIQSGDKEAVEVALTQWEDVNRTLAASAKMDKAIEDAKDGVGLDDVLSVVSKVMKVVVTIGMAI